MTGVNVSATTNEAKSETMNDIPSGLRRRPSIPERKKSGRNATIMIIVALKIDAIISFEALKITLIEVSRSSTGLRAFNFNRLRALSTTIIASSTNTPIAIAMPPSDIVFNVNPNELSVITDTRRESGIATREIIVVRIFNRKIKRIITTNIPPSISALETLLTDRCIKSACRNTSVLIDMPEGRDFLRSASRMFRL
jgi:hypothetical protein